MLTKVYRSGPSRQRIGKGFAVAGATPGQIADLVRRWDAEPDGVLLSSSPAQPSAVMLDTGIVWLHDAAQRRIVAARLAKAVEQLNRTAQGLGLTLVPNAFRPPAATSWLPTLCGDFHFVETISDPEREVCCNFLRDHSPALIALTGRCGFTESGKEGMSSQRLGISTRHYGARYFASVSPLHIDRVTRELRRQSGISRIDLLDISPEDGSAGKLSGVAIRCVDGQILTHSAMAHALLCQALALRARRMVREGRRVGSTPQHLIDSNRARAIAAGLRGRFIVENKRRDDRGRGSQSAPPKLRSADEIAMELIFELLPEFQLLEAEYEEIAPLVLGTSLRAMGLPGIRNENDLLTPDLTKAAPGWDKLIQKVRGWWTSEAAGDGDALRGANEARFPEQCRHVRGWWELLLREPVEERRQKTARPTPPDRDGKRNDRRGGRSRETREEGAFSRLLGALQGAGEEMSDAELAALLGDYRVAGGHPDLDRFLASAGQEPDGEVRRLLRGREQRVELPPENIAWTRPPLREVLAGLGTQQVANLRCRVEKRRLSQTISLFERLRNSLPEGADLYLLELRRMPSDAKEMMELQFLLARRPKDASDDG